MVASPHACVFLLVSHPLIKPPKFRHEVLNDLVSSPKDPPPSGILTEFSFYPLTTSQGGLNSAQEVLDL